MSEFCVKYEFAINNVFQQSRTWIDDDCAIEALEGRGEAARKLSISLPRFNSWLFSCISTNALIHLPKRARNYRLKSNFVFIDFSQLALRLFITLNTLHLMH